MGSRVRVRASRPQVAEDAHPAKPHPRWLHPGDPVTAGNLRHLAAPRHRYRPASEGTDRPHIAHVRAAHSTWYHGAHSASGAKRIHANLPAEREHLALRVRVVPGPAVP